jgi:hypothetical protein
MTLSGRVCKITLAVVLLGCLILQLLGVVWLWLQHAPYPDDASQVVIALLKIYPVPMGVILAGIFARRITPEGFLAHLPFLIALAVSAIWNLLLIGRTAAFVFAPTDSRSGYIGQVEGLVGSATFLVAGAIAYFFATRPGVATKRKGDLA